MKIKMMPSRDPFNIDWMLTLLCLALSAFGSIAKTAFDIINGKPVGLKIAICQFIVSMFAGVLTLLLASSLHLSSEVTGCLSGSAGWLGAEMIKIITDRMKKTAGGK